MKITATKQPLMKPSILVNCIQPISVSFENTDHILYLCIFFTHDTASQEKRLTQIEIQNHIASEWDNENDLYNQIDTIVSNYLKGIALDISRNHGPVDDSEIDLGVADILQIFTDEFTKEQIKIGCNKR